MGYLEATNTTKELIETSEQNQKGTVGVIACAVIALAGYAIKVISDK